MDLERGTPGNQKRIPALGLFLYKVLIYIFIILWSDSLYGSFTDGLPPSFAYRYIISSVYFHWTKVRILEEVLCRRLQIIRFNITDTCMFLHSHTWSIWVLLGLIIYYCLKIAYYHTP